MHSTILQDMIFTPLVHGIQSKFTVTLTTPDDCVTGGFTDETTKMAYFKLAVADHNLPSSSLTHPPSSIYLSSPVMDHAPDPWAFHLPEKRDSKEPEPLDINCPEPDNQYQSNPFNAFTFRNSNSSNTRISSPGSLLRSYDLDNFFAKIPPLGDANMAQEPTNEERPYSEIEAWAGLGRTHTASNNLQQILGFIGPDVCAMPPEMPHGLEEVFAQELERITRIQKSGPTTAFCTAEGLWPLNSDIGASTSRTTLDRSREEIEDPMGAGLEDGGDGIDGWPYNGFVFHTTPPSSYSSGSETLRIGLLVS
ncbi:hypothetical protein J1614_010096 [Plenodomus biglobosus]|nr:hypothetical protein J1614_010096 [Plenodomus biglobosus]